VRKELTRKSCLFSGALPAISIMLQIAFFLFVSLIWCLYSAVNNDHKGCKHQSSFENALLTEQVLAMANIIPYMVALTQRKFFNFNKDFNLFQNIVFYLENAMRLSKNSSRFRCSQNPHQKPQIAQNTSKPSMQGTRCWPVVRRFGNMQLTRNTRAVACNIYKPFA